MFSNKISEPIAPWGPGAMGPWGPPSVSSHTLEPEAPPVLRHKCPGALSFVEPSNPILDRDPRNKPCLGKSLRSGRDGIRTKEHILQSNGFTICVFLYKTEGCTRVWQGDHRTNQNIEQRKRLQFNGKRPWSWAMLVQGEQLLKKRTQAATRKQNATGDTVLPPRAAARCWFQCFLEGRTETHTDCLHILESSAGHAHSHAALQNPTCTTSSTEVVSAAKQLQDNVSKLTRSGVGGPFSSVTPNYIFQQ